MKNTLISGICILFSAFHSFGQANIKEGKEAVYVFISNQSLSEQTPMDNITGAVLYRQLPQEKDFRSLGRIQAQLTREGFVKTAGTGVLNDIRKMKGLRTEDEAWEYVKANPELEKYGMLALNTGFLVAMGAVYEDKEAKKVKSVKYRIEYITAGNKKEKPFEAGLTLGVPPAIDKPVLKELLETDSTIAVSWILDPVKSPDVFMGEIWMREKANAAFQKVGYSMALQVENQVTFNWTEKVKPGISYGFFILPVTLLGLEGPKSDTANLISKTFTTLPQVPIAQVTDTLGGVWVSWEKLNSTELISGILIERSKNPESGFILLDTLAPSSTSFYDHRILPNTLYHYRFRTLGLRQDISEPSAYVSHQLIAENRAVEAPEKVVLSHDTEGNIRLTWNKVVSPEISGYQVFRSVQGKEDFDLVSNLLEDTSFTDTTVRNSRVVYRYTVKALNYENQTSGPSEIVFGSPKKHLLPATPYNVESYTEPGKVTVRWKDMVSYDENIVSYTIYRKEVAAGSKPSDKEISINELKALGFQRINTAPVTEVIYADPSVSSLKQYQYAVTATDIFGVEGPALGVIQVSIPAVSLRVPEIYVRATSKGVEITWTDIVGVKTDSYAIYVRLPHEKAPRKIGEAPAGKEHFIDTRVTPGQLYFYSMKVKAAGRESNSGNEKSVRK